MGATDTAKKGPPNTQAPLVIVVLIASLECATIVVTENNAIPFRP